MTGFHPDFPFLPAAYGYRRVSKMPEHPLIFSLFPFSAIPESFPVPHRPRKTVSEVSLPIDTGGASGYDSLTEKRRLSAGACFFGKIVIGLAPIFEIPYSLPERRVGLKSREEVFH